MAALGAFQLIGVDYETTSYAAAQHDRDYSCSACHCGWAGAEANRSEPIS